MMVVLWRIRVASGNAAAPAAPDEALRRLLPLPGRRGALADAVAAPDEALRQPSAGGRESLGEVSP